MAASPEYPSPAPARRVHYAWVVAGCGFLTLLITAGVRSSATILIVPLEHQFGWSRAVISAAIAINLLLFGLVGPFAAAIMDRFGLRRTMVTALLIMAAGVALTALMTEPWQMMLLWGGVVGFGTGLTAMVLGTTLSTRWFNARRGVVLGLLTASTATGQLVFLPALARLLELSNWRVVTLTIAAAALLTILPVALLMRDWPEDVGLARFGEAAPLPGSLKPPRRRLEDPVRRAFATLGIALGRRDFWLLGGSFFICGASTNGLIGTHLIPACIDHGLPELTGAGLLASMGVFDFFGTTGSGWLSDRIDGRKLLAWYYGLRGLSLIFLPFAFQYSFWGLGLFAMFYGLDWIATVPPTVRLASRSFGDGQVAVVFGWIGAMHQIGAASAAWAAGALRVETGDYLSAFLGAGVLCLIASVLVTWVGGGAALGSPSTSPT